MNATIRNKIRVARGSISKELNGLGDMVLKGKGKEGRHKKKNGFHFFHFFHFHQDRIFSFPFPGKRATWTNNEIRYAKTVVMVTW